MGDPASPINRNGSLLQTLRAFGDPNGRIQEKRYQKSRWEHWGVPLPKMDVAIKETLGESPQDEALEFCRRLWREPVWDLKIVAGADLWRGNRSRRTRESGASSPNACPISTAGRWRTILRPPRRAA